MLPASKLKSDAVSSARICVPVCVPKISEMRRAIKRARSLSDVIEVRLDCLKEEELNSFATVLDSILRNANRLVVLTLRCAAQGGMSSMTALKRHSFWLKHLALGKTSGFLADIELSTALLFQQWEREGEIKLDWDRVICSHHDFEAVPSDLETIYERMKETPARVLKIAVSARDATDCLPVFKILARAKSEGRRLIPIAMGNAGIPTRILGPSRGAFLTFGALDQSQATAPGQITAADLHDVYRIHNINEKTEIYGVVGSPVAHSVSTHVHNAAFAALDINAVYLPLKVRDIGNFMRRMVRSDTREMDWELRGFSVTAPHKSEIIKYLDWIEPVAEEIGAVNTVVIEDGFMRGYNTDALAALAPLENSIEIAGARVAVIGAGGAARALLWSLHKSRTNVTIFARNLANAAPVAENFGTRLMPLDRAVFDGFDVVINATPLGARGNYENQTPAVAEQLRGARFVYDLVYNPAETRLLREAVTAGCETVGGLAMLIAQASEQFLVWTGKVPPLEVMENAASRALFEQETYGFGGELRSKK